MAQFLPHRKCSAAPLGNATGNGHWLFSESCKYTGLFEMIVGVLTTCHTQYTWDRSICFFIFHLIEQHSKFLLHNLQVLYMCILCDSTNINTMMIRCYSPGHLVLQMQMISIYGVTSRIRFMFLLFPQVSLNWRYESEPPLKPSPLTCYKQFGTNLIIVLMFVES